MNGLTTPSPIHLSRTWLNSSAVHGITGGSSNTFPSGLFLFSPADAVIAWDAGSLFVLMVCAVIFSGYLYFVELFLNVVLDLFNRGQTKPQSSTTEAESYLRLAQAARLLPDRLLFERSTTENYALDSFQNLLFSIARFHEFTGHFPSSITIVGYEFKRPRFTELHREALRWPIDKFNYVGVDPKDGHGEDAMKGEVRTHSTVTI